jgi:hypothetical protein
LNTAYDSLGILLVTTCSEDYVEKKGAFCMKRRELYASLKGIIKRKRSKGTCRGKFLMNMCPHLKEYLRIYLQWLTGSENACRIFVGKPEGKRPLGSSPLYSAYFEVHRFHILFWYSRSPRDFVSL